MPYLTWKKSSGDLELKENPDLQMQLALGVSPAELGELTSALRELDTSAELRLTLNDQWVIFWKLREGESRLLLAHPEQESWAATLALIPPDLERLVAELTAITTGGSVGLRSLFSVGWMSNFDVVIQAR